MRHKKIEVCCDTYVRAIPLVGDARVPVDDGAADCLRVVCACVVGDDELQVAKRLPENGLNRGLEVSRSIKTGSPTVSVGVKPACSRRATLPIVRSTMLHERLPVVVPEQQPFTCGGVEMMMHRHRE